MGINLVTNHQRRPLLGFNHPSAFIALFKAHRAAVLLGAEALQVFGKFTHQVAARNPNRQAQNLWGLGRRNGQRDVIEMGLKLVTSNLIVRAAGRGSERLFNEFDLGFFSGGHVQGQSISVNQVTMAPNKQLNTATTVARKRKVNQGRSAGEFQVRRSTA